MPNNGLLYSWQRVRFRMKSAGSWSAVAKGHTATAWTRYVPNAIDVLDGIRLVGGSSDDGAGATSWAITYYGPGAPPTGITWSGSTFLSTFEVILEPTNFKGYCKLTGSLLRQLWDSLNVYVNGSLVATLSAYDDVSAGVGPNYIPAVAIPLKLGGGVSASSPIPSVTYDACNPGAMVYDVTSSGSSTVSGGYEVQEEDGSWSALPVAIWSHDIPAGFGCPFGLDAPNFITADDSYSISIANYTYTRTKRTYEGRTMLNTKVTYTCEGTVIGTETLPSYCIDPCTGAYGQGYRDAYKIETTTDGYGGECAAIANLERSLFRLNSSYESALRRLHFPQVKGAATRTCVDGATTVNTGGEFEVYPDLGADFLAVVTASPSAWEDAFPATIYTESSQSRQKTRTVAWDYKGATVCECPPPGAHRPTCDGGLVSSTCETVPLPTDVAVNQSESVALTFPSSVGTFSGAQSHADPLCRYHATWCNPWWMLCRHREDWKVDGSPVAWTDYWGKIKCQWDYNAALPSGQKTKHRTALVGSIVYDDNGHQPFQDTYQGGLPWIGCSRFRLLERSLSSSLTLSTSRPAVWSSSDCTIALGTDVVLSAFTASPAIVDLELAGYGTNPYLALLRAWRVALSWVSTNVTALSASVVGYDGSETLLGAVAGSYVLPVGAQSKYAGTHAIDNGVGAVTDTGTDSLGTGISATIMADAEGVVGMEMALGRQAKAIRFRITPTNPANPVTLHWPSFDLKNTHPRVFWESSKTATLCWDDGPAIRWGQQKWYDPGPGFMDPPAVQALGMCSTIIDAFAFDHRVLEGDGGATLATTITAQCAATYDAYEGQSIGVVDKLGTAFILPAGADEKVRFALLNSFSEAPPLNAWPTKKRDPDNWKATGAYAQVVYDLAEPEKRLVSPTRAAAKLTTAAGVDVGAFEAGAPAGWSVWLYNPALDNDETGYKVVAGGREFAQVRPWIGWLAFLRPPGGKALSYDVSQSQFHARAYIKDGTMWTGWADTLLADWHDFDTGLDVETACIRWEKNDQRGRLFLWTVVSGNLREYVSINRGETWTLSTTIATGLAADTPLACICATNRLRHILWRDGTSVKGQVLDVEDNVVVSTYTALSGLDADSDVVSDESVIEGGKKRLVLFGTSGGDLTQWISTDGGLTFI